MAKYILQGICPSSTSVKFIAMVHFKLLLKCLFKILQIIHYFLKKKKKVHNKSLNNVLRYSLHPDIHSYNLSNTFDWTHNLQQDFQVEGIWINLNIFRRDLLNVNFYRWIIRMRSYNMVISVCRFRLINRQICARRNRVEFWSK